MRPVDETQPVRGQAHGLHASPAARSALHRGALGKVTLHPGDVSGAKKGISPSGTTGIANFEIKARISIVVHRPQSHVAFVTSTVGNGRGRVAGAHAQSSGRREATIGEASLFSNES